MLILICLTILPLVQFLPCFLLWESLDWSSQNQDMVSAMLNFSIYILQGAVFWYSALQFSILPNPFDWTRMENGPSTKCPKLHLVPANTTGPHRKVLCFMEGYSFVCFGISLWVRPSSSPFFMSANRGACIRRGETHGSPVFKTPTHSPHTKLHLAAIASREHISKLSKVRATNSFP